MPTSLVTGGAGFIGSHLCDFLLDVGHRVICVDNLDISRQQNIEHIEAVNDFRFVNHDLTETLSLADEIDFVSTWRARQARSTTRGSRSTR